MEKITFMKPDGSLDAILYSKIAEEMAVTLGLPHKENRNTKFDRRSQIRKFYDEVNRLQTIVDGDRSKWKIVEPQLHMLVAKTAYAEGRGLVSRDFSKFIRESIEQTDNPDNLRIFGNFFEAFMGFYKLHGPTN